MTTNYLLDTCVLSEIVSKKPSANVLEWLYQQNEDTLFLSVLTIGEIQKGIVKLPASARKRRLEAWLENDLITRFGERILPLDSEVLLEWGKLTGSLSKKGRVLPVIDSLLMATAIHCDLIIVTRNVTDFAGTGVDTLNIWK